MGIFNKRQKKDKAKKEVEQQTSKKDVKQKEKDVKNTKKNIDRTRQDEIAGRVEADMLAETPDANPKSKGFKKKKRKKVEEKLQLRQEWIEKIKPIGNMKFGSVDMQLDGRYATILTFVVMPGSFNKLEPLWGINAIPRIIRDKSLRGKDIESKLLYNISRRSDKWAESKIPQAIEVAQSGHHETTKGSQATEAMRFRDRFNQTQDIAYELKNGSSYLDLSLRIVIKAPTQEDLTSAIRALEREYQSIFSSTVQLVPFVGEQDVEYAGMLNIAEEQLGENYQLTSRELAGSYPFVTRGVNDINGTYVGSLAYEVNSDPVLLNTLNFEDLAVICAKGTASDLSSKFKQNVKHNFKATTGWSVKIAQDALMQGRKVMHMVLNEEDPRRIPGAIDLRDISLYVDLTSEKSGINMLESFSYGMDEQGAYNVLITKIITIIRQFSQKLDEHDDTTLNSADVQVLQELLRMFYIDKGMWVSDAKSEKEDIRLLNIPHGEVPKLNQLVIYAKSALVTESQGDNVNTKSYRKIYGLLKEISDNHGDLFDRKTKINRQKLREKQQVIFDFKHLKLRTEQGLMGHFVNTFSFGEGELRDGDVLIIHGMDEMTPSVCEYLQKRIRHLHQKGVKVVLMYEEADIMLSKDPKYRQHIKWFEHASMKLTNPMTNSSVSRYSEVLRVGLPESVKQGMSGTDRHVYLMNRQNDVILFNWDIVL